MCAGTVSAKLFVVSKKLDFVSFLCYKITMRRRIAKTIHETVNATYWLEHPEFTRTSKLQTAAMEAYRKALPFSPHKVLKNLLFSTSNLLAISGESVVVARSEQDVDKYMFRYPKDMGINTFRGTVEEQTQLVKRHLGEIALDTEVSIKGADIFRLPIGPVPAVTQAQPRLNTELNPPMRLSAPESLSTKGAQAQTLRDLEALFRGCEALYNESGMYPDLYDASGNLRINTQTGNLTLIDVMPLNEDGTRLIGDLKPNTNRIGDYIQRARDGILGKYGS